MAAAILFAGMLAVMAAIMTGQQNVFEAELQLQAALVAEEKMQDIVQLDFSAINSSADLVQSNGTMMYREVYVQQEMEHLAGTGVDVLGKDVTVKVWNEAGTRILSELRAFLPAPPTTAGPPPSTKSALRESD